jgi:hypothetical protein
MDTHALQELKLRPNHVLHSNGRKVRPVRPARSGVYGPRARGAVARPQHIDAHNKVLVRVQGAARSDKLLPPAGARVELVARRVSVRRKPRVEENRVVARAVGVKGTMRLGKDAS